MKYAYGHGISYNKKKPFFQNISFTMNVANIYICLDLYIYKSRLGYRCVSVCVSHTMPKLFCEIFNAMNLLGYNKTTFPRKRMGKKKEEKEKNYT